MDNLLFYVMIVAGIAVIPTTAAIFFVKSRKQERLVVTSALIFCGIAIAIHGHITGRFAAFMSEKSLGFIFLTMAILSLLKINIWMGTPLDPQRDHLYESEKTNKK
jgi:hypothetical protein